MSMAMTVIIFAKIRTANLMSDRLPTLVQVTLILTGEQ